MIVVKAPDETKLEVPPPTEVKQQKWNHFRPDGNVLVNDVTCLHSFITEGDTVEDTTSPCSLRFYVCDAGQHPGPPEGGEGSHHGVDL